MFNDSIILYFFIAIFVIIVLLVLQAFLSSRKSTVWGLILPTACFSFSIFAILKFRTITGNTGFEGYGVIAWYLLQFFLANAPTVIFLLIRSMARKSDSDTDDEFTEKYDSENDEYYFSEDVNLGNTGRMKYPSFAENISNYEPLYEEVNVCYDELNLEKKENQEEKRISNSEKNTQSASDENNKSDKKEIKNFNALQAAVIQSLKDAGENSNFNDGISEENLSSINNNPLELENTHYALSSNSLPKSENNNPDKIDSPKISTKNDDKKTGGAEQLVSKTENKNASNIVSETSAKETESSISEINNIEIENNILSTEKEHAANKKTAENKKENDNLNKYQREQPQKKSSDKRKKQKNEKNKNTDNKNTDNKNIDAEKTQKLNLDQTIVFSKKHLLNSEKLDKLFGKK